MDDDDDEEDEDDDNASLDGTNLAFETVLACLFVLTRFTWPLRFNRLWLVCPFKLAFAGPSVFNPLWLLCPF